MREAGTSIGNEDDISGNAFTRDVNQHFKNGQWAARRGIADTDPS